MFLQMSKLLLKSAMHQNNRSAGTPVPQHAPLAAAAAAAQYTPQLGDMPPACMELVLGHLGEADKRAVLGVSHAMQRAVLCHAASVTLQQVTEGSQHQQSQEGSSTRNSGGAAIEAVTYLSPGGGSMRQLTLVADAGGLQRISCIPALRDGRVKSLVLKVCTHFRGLSCAFCHPCMLACGTGMFLAAVPLSLAFYRVSTSIDGHNVLDPYLLVSLMWLAGCRPAAAAGLAPQLLHLRPA